MGQSSPPRYARPQVILHWAVAVLIALQFLLSDAIGAAFRDGMKTGVFALDPLVVGHIAGGLAVALFLALRLWLRLRLGVPAAPAGKPPAAKILSRVVLVGLYGLMLLIPLSGMIAWSQHLRLPAQVHEALTSLLMGLLALHVAGALVGQFVLRDGTLARMR